MNLTTARANLGAGVTLMLVIALAGWFLLLGPATAKVGETRAQITDTAERNLLLTAQHRALEAQAEDLTRTRAAARDLGRMWPATADQPGFFRAVTAAAATAGYGEGDVTALSPSAPTPVAAGTPIGIAAGATPVPEGSAAPAPGSTPEGTVDGTAAVEPTVAVQTLTLTVEGTYEQAQVLLAQLERLPRSVLVLTVGFQPGAGDELTLTVTGATFVASPMREPRAVPATDPAAAGATDPATGAGSAEAADGVS